MNRVGGGPSLGENLPVEFNYKQQKFNRYNLQFVLCTTNSRGELLK